MKKFLPAALSVGIVFALWMLLFIWALHTLDPDFGWHLRMGQEILARHAVPKTDFLSYTMPSFRYIDHEWFADVLLAFLFPRIGMVGLASVFSSVVIAAFLIVAQVFRKSYLLPFFILAVYSIVSVFGIRVQVLSWLFFSLLLWVIFTPQKFFWLLLPLLFLLWANMHGSFSIGLCVLGFWFLYRLCSRRESLAALLGIVLASFAITLVNPYGITLWKEVIVTVTSSNLKQHIVEWQPLLIFSYSAGLLFFLALSMTFIIIFFKQISFFTKVLFFGFFLLAVSAIRHLPFFSIVALSMLATQYEQFARKKIFTKNQRKKLKIAEHVLLSVVVALVFLSLFLDKTPLYSRFDKDYPVQAVAFLKSHKTCGNVFTAFDWGGYVDWQYPQKKIFIDGRMPVWQRNKAPSGESTSAFAEYEAFVLGKIPFTAVVQKYHISAFLLPTLYLSSKAADYKKFFSQLQKSGFTVAYTDAVATVFMK